ncbi:hypothetical protein PVK06_008598 [Gossypium arboreum]|uniref:Uncharacterized protein n=1 Tax=Gossypium arboreum TaxID=29729 RepID=A0ABR0QKA8_GOSAR|nr:hypothetical protein PVK06_008598 [Gossypium arboreum]
MDVLRRDVQELHPNVQDMDWLFCSNNPLSLEVAVVNLPSEFKVPKEMFEGRRDPKAYLIQYNDYMNVLRAFDTVKCKSFLTTLKGSEKDRYLSLQQGSLQSFSQLGQIIFGRFRAYRMIMTTSMGLMSTKQRDGEYL